MKALLNSLTGSGFATGLAGGVSGGLLVGLLGGKKPRKLAGKALKLGGAAVIGGLAWEAYRRYQQNQAQSGVQGSQDSASWMSLEHNAFASASPDVASDQEALIIKAMIAAAQADGDLDQAERLRILERIERSEATLEQKARLLNDMSTPQDVINLVRPRPCPELAVELYVASALVLDCPTPSGHPHLSALATLLDLPPDLTEEIHRSLQHTQALGDNTANAQRSRINFEANSHVA